MFRFDGTRVIGGTQKGRSSTCWIRWFKPVDGERRQIRAFLTSRGDDEIFKIAK